MGHGDQGITKEYLHFMILGLITSIICFLKDLIQWTRDILVHLYLKAGRQGISEALQWKSIMVDLKEPLKNNFLESLIMHLK
jgi:hypothetical protein